MNPILQSLKPVRDEVDLGWDSQDGFGDLFLCRFELFQEQEPLAVRGGVGTTPGEDRLVE